MINQHHARKIMLSELKNDVGFTQHCYEKSLKHGLIAGRIQIDVCLSLMLKLRLFTKAEINSIGKFIIKNDYIGCLMHIYLLLHQNIIHK